MPLDRQHESRRAETWTCRTVTAPGSDLVHLVITTGAGSALPDATLCDEPVSHEPPAERFQARGCRRCAEASLEHGILGASDRGGAVVNLQRFHARTGPAGPATPGSAADASPGPSGSVATFPHQLPPSA